jgi:hypothetical protein
MGGSKILAKWGTQSVAGSPSGGKPRLRGRPIILTRDGSNLPMKSGASSLPQQSGASTAPLLRKRMTPDKRPERVD